MHEVGLTPRQLDPTEFASVLDYEVGLTDLCKLQSGSDSELSPAGFDVERLTDLIRKNAPTVIAFNGLRAGRASLDQVDGYGLQQLGFAGAEAWVLPSTSGAANRWWDVRHWQELGERVR